MLVLGWFGAVQPLAARFPWPFEAFCCTLLPIQHSSEQGCKLSAWFGIRPRRSCGPGSTGIAEATASGQGRPPRTRSAPAVPYAAEAEDPARRAQWIEPLGGDPHWRVWMWGSIVALHGRYPTELAHLKDGWWDNTSHVETLCTRGLARLDRHHRRRPTARARIPPPTHRLRSRTTPRRWQHRAHLETRPPTRRLDLLTRRWRERKNRTQGDARVGSRGRVRATGSSSAGSCCGRVAAVTCIGGVGFASCLLRVYGS